MTEQTAKLVTACIFAIPGLFALALPGCARRAARGFPDSRPVGMLLSTMALLWAAALIYYTPLDFIASFRIHLTAFLLVSIPLSWMWMRTLLAARSLGALMCLVPAPVLVAVRFAPGAGRLVTVSLMYVVAVAGMISTFSPYYMRDALFRFNGAGNAAARAIGALMLAAGLAAFLA